MQLTVPGMALGRAQERWCVSGHLFECFCGRSPAPVPPNAGHRYRSVLVSIGALLQGGWSSATGLALQGGTHRGQLRLTKATPRSMGTAGTMCGYPSPPQIALSKRGALQVKRALPNRRGARPSPTATGRLLLQVEHHTLIDKPRASSSPNVAKRHRLQPVARLRLVSRLVALR